ncbi:MAG TPA: hypothetical protein VKL99_09475 [Candidatus Angelobacter sp.]|nr:hypothetical protein [Candidatus Angelobacter sp.]
MSALRIAFSLLVLISAGLLSQAQQAQSVPPAILEIYRDPVKPAKMPEYTRIEGEAALACARASTWPYLAMQSISGPQTEVWYMEGFDSYAAVEHSSEPFVKNAALGGELNRLMEAKVNLVGDARVVFAHYRDDLSSNSGLVQPRTRFFAVTMVTVRPGHEREYEEIHRTLRAVRQRTSAADNRVVYQVVSGMPRNIYLIFSAYRSMQNAGNALDPAMDDYASEVDDSTRNRLDDYTRVSVVSSETWLFSVNPVMSNPAGEWIVEDPEFWRSSPAMQRQAGSRK